MYVCMYSMYTLMSGGPICTVCVCMYVCTVCKYSIYTVSMYVCMQYIMCVDEGRIYIHDEVC